MNILTVGDIARDSRWSESQIRRAFRELAEDDAYPDIRRWPPAGWYGAPAEQASIVINRARERAERNPVKKS